MNEPTMATIEYNPLFIKETETEKPNGVVKKKTRLATNPITTISVTEILASGNLKLSFG